MSSELRFGVDEEGLGVIKEGFGLGGCGGGIKDVAVTELDQEIK